MTGSNLTFISVVERDDGLSNLMVQSIRRFKPDARILIADNGSNPHLAEYGAELIPNRPTVQGGSNRHAEGLNLLFPMVETEYCVVMDSDAALVSGDWQPTHALTAAPKHGTQEGCWHMCFAILRTADFKGIDFSPADGYDVGFRVQHKDWELLQFVDTKTGHGRTFDSTIQSDELFLDWKPVAVHLGRGSNLKGKLTKTPKPLAQQVEEWKTRVKELIK